MAQSVLQFSLPLLNSHWLSEIQRKFIATFITDDRYVFFLIGFKNTILISIIATVLGTLIGMIVAFGRASKIKWISKISKMYIDIIRGTPALTQLLIIYFVILARTGLSATVIASIAFGINSGAYVAEIIRAGISSVNMGQMEAGRSLGLTQRQTMIYIIMPQAIKNIIPALANEFIVLIKETAICGNITVMDLTKAALSIQGITYDFAFPLISVALMYYVLTKSLSILFRKLEDYFNRSERQGGAI